MEDDDKCKVTINGARYVTDLADPIQAQLKERLLADGWPERDADYLVLMAYVFITCTGYKNCVIDHNQGNEKYFTKIYNE